MNTGMTVAKQQHDSTLLRNQCFRADSHLVHAHK